MAIDAPLPAEAPAPGAPLGSTGVLLDLGDAAAIDPDRAGGKAAALARAAAAGFRTLPGAVVPTELSGSVGTAGEHPDLERSLHAVIDRFGGDLPLVVRSSSVAEDTEASSKAGQFESVLGVVGLDALREAVAVVHGSRVRAGVPDEPIAVLVQPMIDPPFAGVAFGVDPVTGRSDRRVVAAVRGTPDQLVSGEVDGSRWTLDDQGTVVDERLDDGVDPGLAVVRRVVALGDALAEAFDGPQDVEWALGEDGEPIVLQSRPVTTEVRGVPSGPVYGPGPVAETFPEALSPLEVDLWVGPLRDGVREALRITGAVAQHELDERELVVTVEGQVAIDLQVTGEVEQRLGFAASMGARVRRLRSAWRIGRLRVALPVLAHDLCERADADLEGVPPLGDLTTRQLVALIGRGRTALKSLHAHEILLGLVSGTTSSSFTGASVALRVLVEARRDGLDDDAIVRRAPVVLALVPPRVGDPIELPEASTAGDLRREPAELAAVQVSREVLRMRVRWMQELVGRSAAEVGRRLVERGELDDLDVLGSLTLEDLAATASWQAEVEPAGVARARRAAARVELHRPASLPAAFQLSDTGRPIPVVEAGAPGGGTGAGGGVGTGVVTHDAADPPDGAILVVSALTPQLGPVLDRLAGIVAETGSVLSHLAILARESGVPVVVGHRRALEQLPEGLRVTVDGGSGHVEEQAA